MRSRRHKKEKLEQAKSGRYRHGSSTSLDCPAIKDWLSRILFFLTRTALVFTLMRIVFVKRKKAQATPAIKGAANVAAKAVADAEVKVASQATAAAVPAATAPPAPAFTGPMRSWEWKDEGEDPILFTQQTQIPEYKNILFLGDSTYSKMAGYLTQPWQAIFPTSAFFEKSGTCSRMQYYRLQAGTWVKPDYTKGEGPGSRGVQFPFCGDCPDCKSGRINSGGRPYGWEYLFVDYARDVEQPTRTTKTSQETVALYLKNSPHPSRLCVVNAGIYDMMLPGMTIDLFLGNLKDYLNLIAPSCQTIVWVTIGATNLPGGPQRNENIQVWNTRIKEMLAQQTALLPKLVYLDAWQASVKATNVDPIHKNDVHYRALGRLFIAPIEKAVKG